MPNCINYDCDDALGNYQENECGEELVGGSSAGVLLECNHQLTDPSSTAQVNAEIAAGRATLVTGCSFSIEPPSPVEQDSIVPCRPSSVTTYNRSGIYKNPNVSGPGVTFHKPIFAGRKFGGLILYECGTEDAINPQVTWIDRTITFTGGRILPGATTDKQRFEGAFKYIGKTDDDIYPVPPGIFS